MPPYTDSPLGAFLTQIGQGLPALGTAHRAKQLSDINLRDQQIQQSLNEQKLVDEPMNHAREAFKLSNEIDPMRAWQQTQLLEQAGIPMVPGTPPNKAFDIAKQGALNKFLGGASGAPGSAPQSAAAAGPEFTIPAPPTGNAQQQAPPPQVGAPPSGAQRGGGMFDNTPENRMMMKLLGLDPDSVIGPANEPVEKIPMMQGGQPGYKYAPRSQVNDPNAVQSALWHADAPSDTMRDKNAQNEGSLDSIGRAEQIMTSNPKWQQWVGPAAGRWGEWKQSVPGMAVDPEQAAFYGITQQFKDALLYARSGQAINENELARLENELPKASDNPTVFSVKMGQTKQNIADLIKRRGGQAPSWYQSGALTAPVSGRMPIGPPQGGPPQQQGAAPSGNLLQQYANKYFDGDMNAARQAVAASLTHRAQ